MGGASTTGAGTTVSDAASMRRLRREIEKADNDRVILRSMELQRALVARLTDLERRVADLEQPRALAAQAR